MKNLFISSLIAILTLSMISCDNSSDDFLISSNGKWNVTTHEYQNRSVVVNTVIGDSAIYTFDGTFDPNTGTMTFEDDGDGVLNTTFSGIPLAVNFSYTMDEDAQTITIIYQSPFPYINPITYTIDESSKDAQRFSVSDYRIETEGNELTRITETGNIVLSK